MRTEYGISVDGRDPDPEDVFTDLHDAKAATWAEGPERVMMRRVSGWEPVADWKPTGGQRKSWRIRGWELAEHYPPHHAELLGHVSEDKMRVAVCREHYPLCQPSAMTYMREGWRMYRLGARIEDL